MPSRRYSQVGVYYNKFLCGELVENEENYTFKYNESYVEQKLPVISHNFPLQVSEFPSDGKSLHPFFDNLASEGWLRQHQADALKTTNKDKFTILTHFGYDMAGAVYFETPEINTQEYPMTVESKVESEISEKTNFKRVLSIESRASISGIQKKVLVRKQTDGEFVMTTMKQLSTHIAKLFTEEYPEIIELEFLSMLAVANLLPDDSVCEIEIGVLSEIGEKALFVKRFDRNENDERIHFEEFNSLLGKVSDDKYDASYEDIGHFIRTCKKCRVPHQTCLTVYKRILASILIGNTDAHLKNFAMFHMSDGSLTLTPMYDVVCSSFYPKFAELALKINNQKYDIGNVKPKNLVKMGRYGFGLSDDEIRKAIYDLETNLAKTIDVLKDFKDKYITSESNTENTKMIEIILKLIEIILKRWNGSFNGIPTYLNKSVKQLRDIKFISYDFK